MLLNYETECEELADQSRKVLSETATTLRAIAANLPEEAQIHLDMCELAESYEVVASEVTVVDMKVADRIQLNDEADALMQRIQIAGQGLQDLIQ